MVLLSSFIFLWTGLSTTVDTIPATGALKDTTPVTLQQIVVTASRLPEQLLYAPVTIERLSLKDLSRAASPSFFDALDGVKGVQMITPSLGFKVLNTRGFANTTNVRFTQMVDGMDVQAPHIGTPIGNVLGPSDLDIESVELIPGSSSALFGMNTINGIANFATKSAFTRPGVQLLQKTGVNHLGSNINAPKPFSETAIRWAHIFSERLAFKINSTFSKGYDWVADDSSDLNKMANVSTGLTGTNNPALDPVNSYGNESANRRTLSLQGKNYVVARTGYFEKEVADYNLQNIKADATIQYKGGRNTELSYTYKMALLNSVYQRSNRFRLENYLVQQHGVQLKHRSLNLRAYLNR